MREVQHCGQISSGHGQKSLQVAGHAPELDPARAEVEGVPRLVKLLLLLVLLRLVLSLRRGGGCRRPSLGRC